MIFFTSILSNYLSRALALAESTLAQHPDSYFRIYIYDFQKAVIPNTACITDFLPTAISPNRLSFHDSSACIPSKSCFQERFNIVEACTAVKPFIFKSLLRKGELITYLDPDIIVYSKIHDKEPTWKLQLTPHILKPAKREDFGLLSERIFANFGVFNLGYVAFKPSPETIDFVNWWADLCDDFGVANTTAGLYVDQKFFDFAPAFVKDIDIVHHPGWNVAWWNLFCDGRDFTSEQAISLDGTIYPLIFFHFSNLDSKNTSPLIAKPLNSLLRYSPIDFTIQGNPFLSTLFKNYKERLVQIDNTLPKQASLKKRIAKEYSLALRIKRRCTDELYRINRFEKQYMQHKKAKIGKSNLARKQAEENHFYPPKTLFSAITRLIFKLAAFPGWFSHLNRMTTVYIGNSMSPSLFRHINQRNKE